MSAVETVEFVKKQRDDSVLKGIPLRLKEVEFHGLTGPRGSLKNHPRFHYRPAGLA